MIKRTLPLLAFLIVALACAVNAQPQPGPRAAQGKAVRLTPVPLNATSAEIQGMLNRKQNLYFKPGVYNIGNLQISGWQSGLIWGAGRLCTQLQGSITIKGSRSLTIGNFNIINNTAKDAAVLDVADYGRCLLTFMNILASAGKDGTALRLQAPGEFQVQGCNLKSSDIGLQIAHPQAKAMVFGGNLQYNRIHIQLVRGHLEGRAFGMQGTRGDADIVIQSPSPFGHHLVEGIRTEGNNGSSPNEMLLKVPQTTAVVNVALRANTLGSMVHYADYNANGTLLLLENVNYPGPEDKSSVGVTVHSAGPSTVISFGNKYGLSYDAAPGPFVIGASTTVQSMGDLWMLTNTSDYHKPFNEPITKAAMQAAGKAIPPRLSFLSTADSATVQLPDFSAYQLAAGPRIANLPELMLNVKDFGAVPNDGKDDRAAIQRALDAAEKGGISEPLFFPAGKYELSEPLFLDHLAGGGFWGEGADRSVLVSTTGKGTIVSDGAGYSTFVDMGFENKPGAESKTTDFDWVNNQSPDKKRGNTGAALQANMIYRCRFENGGTGMAVGNHRMGDGFMLVDCVFKNIQTAKGEGAAYASEGFNVLTNPLIHCSFENVDCAVSNVKGSFNFYGNRLSNIHSAALKFYTIVGNAFALVNNVMDASPVPFVTTGHSSAKAHLLLEQVRIKAPAKTAMGSDYKLGGSVLVSHSSFENRSLANGGGIGDNSLIVYKTVAANASVSGRAHGYFPELLRKKK
ncbi:glycosyl hydrolase family 28-related protein [Flavisolibacter nicotianae]|uniref:glycosyl hydrolase family 28-related protein n=1 Tax=Flavisolibacter nicotianae TaxID=2364882 RepID=UPI0013C4E8F3|nr:glycosyl hydrolase family 28-related protein [Flavisolibacter nicotianae]